MRRSMIPSGGFAPGIALVIGAVLLVTLPCSAQTAGAAGPPSPPPPQSAVPVPPPTQGTGAPVETNKPSLPSSETAPEPAPGVSRALPGSKTAMLLPRDLSPWGMFLSAHLVVKLVMILLALASLASWTIAVAKGLELLVAKRRLRTALRRLGQVPTLLDAAAQLKHRSPLAPSLAAAMLELRLSAEISGKEGAKERVGSRLERIEAAYGRGMTKGTGLLATIGATAPFVGLFGTVWGIMNSFIGISKQHTTNLAVVAPGIAEALLATALGLFAAIPAVVIYNGLSRSIASYRALLGDGSAEVMRLVDRNLDRQESRPSMPKARASSAFSVTSLD